MHCYISPPTFRYFNLLGYNLFRIGYSDTIRLQNIIHLLFFMDCNEKFFNIMFISKIFDKSLISTKIFAIRTVQYLKKF